MLKPILKMAADGRILNSLLSPDDNIRGEAEKSLYNMSVETRALLFLSALASPASEEVKHISSVLLRQLLSINFAELQQKLSTDNLEYFKSQVLLGLQAEQSDCLRKGMCDIASVLATNLLDDDSNNQWPQFLQFLFQCANSSSPALKDNALRIFRSVPSIFGNQESDYLEPIKQMLEQSLLPSQPYEVRVQAVRAVTAFVLFYKKESQMYEHFAQLLPNMLKVVMDSIEKQNENTLLICLLELTEFTPMFLQPQISVIMELCFKILRLENIWSKNSSRHLALEILITLFESNSSVVEKCTGNYIVPLVHEVVKMLTQLEDEKNWSQSDEISQDDSDSPNIIAERALDRLACKLGGVTIWPLIIENIPKMLANPDWKYRHAALMAISAVGRGCHKQMEVMLPQIMDVLLNYLQDPHPRVRYAACNAIGLMSADFAPTFEKKFHEKVIPGLLHVLDDNQNPRTQAHAGAALVNFSEKCPKNILTQYLNSIMSKLEAILSAKFKELVEKGTKLVLEQIVITISSIAETVEEQFISYYDRLMPCLKCIIQNANKDKLKLLRGKTMECVSMIGLAVGPEKFIGDASEVMDQLLKTLLESHSEVLLLDDDPQTVYIILACARICKILGKDFECYLSFVVGPMMRTASVKPEIALFDVNKAVNWQFVPHGKQKNCSIKTLGLGDKASACEMLVCYASYLGEGFGDYAEEVVKLMVPLLKFYVHEGIRTAAAKILPFLLESVKAKGTAYLEGMWSYICPELLKAIDTELESEVLVKLMHSLAKCINTLGVGCFSKESMAELIKILDKFLNEHFVKAMKRVDKRKEEDCDEVLDEQLEDEEYEDIQILSEVAVVLQSLFATYKISFYPYFDQLLGHFVKLLAPERSWVDHQWALCVFDDIIEHSGPACVKYQAYFLPSILQYIQDSSPDVRQAAVYGCGVLGQFGGESFAGFCAEALPRLVEVINAPDSRSVENVNPTENAISAVTKILKHNSSSINVDEVLPHWLSWLPVWEDLDETPHVYGYLCDLIEANHPVVLASNNSNIPNLIAIFGEAFFRDAFSLEDDIAKRVLGIVRQIQSNEDLFKACLQYLNSDQQQALHMALISSIT